MSLQLFHSPLQDLHLRSMPLVQPIESILYERLLLSNLVMVILHRLYVQRWLLSWFYRHEGGLRSRAEVLLHLLLSELLLCHVC